MLARTGRQHSYKAGCEASCSRRLLYRIWNQINCLPKDLWNSRKANVPEMLRVSSLSSLSWLYVQLSFLTASQAHTRHFPANSQSWEPQRSNEVPQTPTRPPSEGHAAFQTSQQAPSLPGLLVTFSDQPNLPFGFLFL